MGRGIHAAATILQENRAKVACSVATVKTGSQQTSYRLPKKSAPTTRTWQRHFSTGKNCQWFSWNRINETAAGQPIELGRGSDFRFPNHRFHHLGVAFHSQHECATLNTVAAVSNNRDHLPSVRELQTDCK